MTKKPVVFQQGDLDGLCGVYAFINALRLVRPIPEQHCESVMQACLQLLFTKTGKPWFFIKGIGLNDMTDLFKGIARTNYGIGYHRPFARNSRVPLAEFWQAGQDFLEQGQRAVVVAVEALHEHHWTVVQTWSVMHLELLDSDGWGRIHRTRVKIGRASNPEFVGICPAQTFFVFDQRQQTG